jgi:hypothetical protein
MIEVHGEVDQIPISEVFNGSKISEEFESSQISNQKRYSFFKMIDMINDNNFNPITWFRGDDKGIFEYDDYQIDEETQKRKMLLYESLDDKPLMLSASYARNLIENLKRIKKSVTYLEYFDCAVYVIEVAKRIAHKMRIIILENAYREFQEAIEKENKNEKEVDREKMIARIMSILGSPLQQEIEERIGNFNPICSYRRVDYSVCIKLFDVIDQERKLVEKECKRRKLKKKTPILIEKEKDYAQSKIAETYRKYNEDREKDKWTEYFNMKKECNITRIHKKDKKNHNHKIEKREKNYKITKPNKYRKRR